MTFFESSEFSLAELEQLRDSSSGQLRRKYSMMIRRFMHQKGIDTLVDNSLTEQRKSQSTVDGIGNLTSLDPNRRITELRESGNSKLVYCELAFSPPEDFIVPVGHNGPLSDDVFSDALVIDPRQVSADLLIGLSLLTKEEFRHSSSEEKIAMKIASLPGLKRILRDATPLQIGSKETGRILLINDPKGPNDGKYIIFMSSTEHDSSMRRGGIQRKTRVSVFDSIYDIIRGQAHALERISEGVEGLDSLSDDILKKMIVRWKDPDYTKESKERDIGEIIRVIGKKRANFIRKALLMRIMRVSYTHAEQDFQRLIGAQNDIARQLAEKLGQGSDIFLQARVLVETERRARDIITDFFYEISKLLIDCTNISYGEEKIILSDIKESRTIKNNFGKIWNILKKNTALLRGLKNLGSPYIEMLYFLEEAIELNHQLAYSRTNNIEFTWGMLLQLFRLAGNIHTQINLHDIRYKYLQKIIGIVSKNSSDEADSVAWINPLEEGMKQFNKKFQ